MWPFSSSSSRVLGIPETPTVDLQMKDFAKNDSVLDVTLSAKIWQMIEWLSVETDTSSTDVVRGLIFHALYGRVAYEQLCTYVSNQSIDDEESELEELSIIVKSPERDESSDIDFAFATEGEIKKSVERGTPVDLKIIGKSNVNRKFRIPSRMLSDLDRQAAKADISLTTYARGLLFKALQGEVNYTHWQYARTELEDSVKPPSKR